LASWAAGRPAEDPPSLPSEIKGGAAAALQGNPSVNTPGDWGSPAAAVRPLSRNDPASRGVVSREEGIVGCPVCCVWAFSLSARSSPRSTPRLGIIVVD
jgi:hypothetical protein